MIEQKPDGRLARLQVLDQSAHFIRLTADTMAAAAGDRISVMTMAFEPGEPGVRLLYDTVGSAALAGAQVTFGVDGYALSVMSGAQQVNRLIKSPGLGTPTRRRLDALHSLSALPHTSVGIVNLLPAWWQLPVSGRSHMKLSGINDTFYIGGPNWHGVWRHDLSARLTNHQSAAALHDMIAQCVRSGSVLGALGTRDRHLSIDRDTNITIDVGRRHQSALLAHAYRIIDEADTSLDIACQYFPDQPLAGRLRAAVQRGVTVSVVVNHPRQHFPGSKQWQSLVGLRNILRSPGSITYRYPDDSQPIHAHALASEKEGLIGTHNFIKLGVSLGTAEIGIMRRTPVFAAELGAAIQLLAAAEA